MLHSLVIFAAPMAMMAIMTVVLECGLFCAGFNWAYEPSVLINYMYMYLRILHICRAY